MQRWIIVLMMSALVMPLWSQQGPQGPSGANPPPKDQQGPGRPPQPIDLAKAGFSEAQIKALKDDKAALDLSSKQTDEAEQAIASNRDQLMAADPVDANAVQADLKKLSDLHFQRDWARVQLQIQWKSTYGAKNFDTLMKAFFPPQREQNGPPPPQ